MKLNFLKHKLLESKSRVHLDQKKYSTNLKLIVRIFLFMNVSLLVSCQGFSKKTDTTPATPVSTSPNSAKLETQTDGTTAMPEGNSTAEASSVSPATIDMARWNSAVRFNARELIALPPEKLKDFEVNEVKVQGWKLTHIFFGFLEQENAEMNFVVSDKVPYSPNRLYGWTARFADASSQAKRPIDITETLILPETPRVLRFNSDTTTVDPTGKKIITRLKVDPKEVWVFNFWQITPEDPKGKYKIELSSDKNALKEFEFELL